MLPYSPYIARLGVDGEPADIRAIAAQQRRVRAAADAAVVREPQLARRMRARVLGGAAGAA
jgi:hypothetical protein